MPGVKPTGAAVTVVFIALVIANGVPFIAVADSNVGEVEYSKLFRVLFPPALITEVNFTDVSVIKEFV